MNSVEIAGKGFAYQAQIGRGLMNRVGELSREMVSGPRCAIIADENSAQFFGAKVRDSLTAKKFEPILITVRAGEHSKSLAQVEKICGEMINAGLDRSSFVVGLGGGVVGDLSGFAVAIFHRGIPHIQIPTTLLAMVDSAIGGKTGVNLCAGKNLVGAIHHPRLVIADTAALDSLPPRELRQGFAEIIKHAIIADADMFMELKTNALADMQSLVARNITIKARIVAEDERDETGERAILNFGHTIGHGIERASDYKIPHGDCISLGMVAACQISIKRAGLTTRERDAIVELLKHYDLPTKLPGEVDREKMIMAIEHDKKFQDGQIRFIVTPHLGKAFVSQKVTMEDIREAVGSL